MIFLNIYGRILLIWQEIQILEISQNIAEMDQLEEKIRMHHGLSLSISKFKDCQVHITVLLEITS